MRIPDHILEQIRQSADIVDVVGEDVALRQRGKNFIGLCPFHNEKTPSFNVNPERGIYKCFGCGKGGNVFTFLMERHTMDFPAAVRALAERCGIELPNDEDDGDDERKNRYDAAFSGLRSVANWYYMNLYGAEGALALKYLYGRGFNDAVIKEFGLGYAPDSWDRTLTELKKQGYAEETLEDTGLAIKREDGGIYDRFRGRLMFPIQNAVGRVLGFGARRLVEDPKQPKYINSPQSLVYDKSKVLYGIHQAKESMRRKQFAILVEGYADAMAVYQAEFHNVVASSGTALTRDQLMLIKRYCPELKIVFDADIAGANAALRGLELALECGLNVTVVRLPAGEDPDSFINKNGAEAFQQGLDSAVTLVDFKGDILRRQGMMNTPHGQAEAVRSLIQTIAKTPDLLQRDFLIRDIALKYTLREEVLYAELQAQLSKVSLKRVATKRNANAVSQDERNAEAASPIDVKSGSTASVASGSDKQEDEFLAEERELLRIALTVAGAAGYMKLKLSLSPDDFISDIGRRWFGSVQALSEKHRDPFHALLNDSALGAEDRDVITGLATRKETSERWKDFGIEITENLENIMKACALKLRCKRCEQILQELRTELKNAPPGKDLEIAAQQQSVDSERRRLLEQIESL